MTARRTSFLGVTCPGVACLVLLSVAAADARAPKFRPEPTAQAVLSTPTPNIAEVAPPEVVPGADQPNIGEVILARHAAGVPGVIACGIRPTIHGIPTDGMMYLDTPSMLAWVNVHGTKAGFESWTTAVPGEISRREGLWVVDSGLGTRFCFLANGSTIEIRKPDWCGSDITHEENATCDAPFPSP